MATKNTKNAERREAVAGILGGDESRAARHSRLSPTTEKMRFAGHSERSEESRQDRSGSLSGWLARLRLHFAPLRVTGVGLFAFSVANLGSAVAGGLR